MSNREAAEFFHGREPSLHHSPEIENTLDYLRQNGEHIANDPGIKIEAYLGFLADPEFVNYGPITGSQTAIDSQIEHTIVDFGEVSDSYFELQRRVVRDELGLDDIKITPKVKRQMTETVREDQRVCLEEWANYLTSDDANYPDWFRYYSFSAITKLTEYDADKERFRRRSNGTAANFPELNQEVLAQVYEAINRRYVIGDNTPNEDARTEELIRVGNFGKLYTHFFNEARPTPQDLEVVEGEWVKYEQTRDEKAVAALTGSLRGKGTGWCTAVGDATAMTQLSNGDFYVYYSRDSEGSNTIPRIAIRMLGHSVVEVRGIEKGQNMEACMYDIVTAKVDELPGGQKWKRVTKNMQHLTAIYSSVANGHELDPQDILFLREYAGKVETFGYKADSRVAKLLHGRNEAEDLGLVIKQFGSEEIANMLLKNGKELVVAQNIDAFDKDSLDIQQLIHKLGPKRTLDIIDKLPPDSFDQESFFHKIMQGRPEASIIDKLLVNARRFKDGAIDFDVIAKKLSDDDWAVWLLIKYADILPIEDYQECLDRVIILSESPRYNDSDSPFYLYGDDDYKFNQEVRFWAKAIAASPDPLAIAAAFAANKGGASQDFLISLAPNLAKAVGKEQYATWLIDNNLESIAAYCMPELEPYIDHAQLASSLFMQNKLDVIADNLTNFKEGVINHNNLVKLLLLDSGGSDIIMRNLEKFQPGLVDIEALYTQLLEQRQGKVICKYIDGFTQVAGIRQIVTDLTELGLLESVEVNFKEIAQGYGLDEFAPLLLRNGCSVLYRKRQGLFDPFDTDDLIVEGLLKDGRSDLVFKRFSSFTFEHYTPTQVIRDAISSGSAPMISGNFVDVVNFMPLDELQQILLENPAGDIVLIRHLSDFSLSSEECSALVSRLCANDQIVEVNKRLGEVLAQADHESIARTLIEHGGAAMIARNLSQFKEGSVDREKLFKALEGEGDYDQLQSVFGKKALNSIDPNKYIVHLLNKGRTVAALSFLAKLPDEVVDREAIFRSLIENGREDDVAANISLFVGTTGKIDKAKLAEILFKKGQVVDIAKNLDFFGAENVNTRLLVKKLLQERELGALLHCFGILPPGSIDPLVLAREWSTLGGEDMSDAQLSKLLKGGGPMEIAEMLIKTGSAHFIDERLSAFLKYVKPKDFAEFLEDVGADFIIDGHKILRDAIMDAQVLDF
jgi:DNA-binding phage protein